MARPELRHGFTTGACAAAAAKGAALMLRDRQMQEEVEINLPAGFPATFRLHAQEIGEEFAACSVIKDAGDDPDVTDGAEIRVTVRVSFFTKHRIVIEGGEGVGRITKPGLALPVGEWAINPVPRRMILEGVKEVLAMRCVPATFTVTVSVPDGEERAKKTLNRRLGIVGGISILGTTGIVRPLSAQAWTATIDSALDVALACGCETVVLSTGRSSELAAQRQLPGPLPEEAFVMMGDHLAYALQAAARKGVKRVVLAAQFAKLVKIACGHANTHAASCELNLRDVARWLRERGAREPAEAAARAHTARELLLATGNDQLLLREVAQRALAAAAAAAPGVELHVFVAGYQGEMLYSA